MKTTGVLLVTSIASVLVAVGCATSPTTDTSDDNDTASPTTSPSKKSSNDAATPTESSSSGSISSSTDASTADASSASTDTDAGSDDSNDAAACAGLGSCCPQLTDSFSQIACFGAQLSGDPTTCAAALIACEAEIIGGSSGGGDMSGAAGSPCLTDDDCSGVLLCENSVCSE